MKKFFPLCLLLIVALVWTVSVASSFERTPTANSNEQVTIEKPRSTVERPAVAQKSVKQGFFPNVPVNTEPIYLDRTPTATAEEAEEAARVAGERAGEIVVVPITTGERIPSPNRMKDIKADGVISPDERALYEELLSAAAPGAELPMPLNIVYESEYNDVCDSADVVACGDTVWCADLTAGSDDADWYTFTLSTAQNVTIETHPTGTDCQIPSMTDTYLELWEAPCDSMIAYNDDIGGTPWNLFSRISVNLVAGTYAILSGNPWAETGSYHLSVICQDIIPDWNCVDDPPWYTVPPGKSGGGVGDIEPNDTCADAGRAMCEYAYCGAVGTSTDSDWYYVDLPADTTYGLHVRVFADDTPGQYAYGGGCDPWVGLYASDCVTLVAANEDYYGTFPDAETYDSQIDPGYPNCFNPGERVYLEIVTNYADPGPYLLIINCVPCEIPQQGCDEDSLTIEIVLDNWPDEVTWDVVDQSTSQVICSGGPYAGSAGDTVTAVCCLDSTGCYDFNIYDAYGDGAGAYNLYLNDVLFYSSDGNYGYGESVQYIGNGCPEPTGACCVGIDCVGTISLDSCNVLGGNWYIDENCSTFVCPFGACCLHDGTCTATTNIEDCDALDGTWYENETCPEFDCPVATSCDTAIYHNGDPIGGARSSQCALDYGFTTETADDFVLPGAGTKYISEVVAWFWFWNGPTDANPAYYDAINVTFYANDNITFPFPAPGGQPIDPPDSLCSHIENIPNGIIYTTAVPAGSFTWVNDGHPQYRLMIPVDVGLTAGDTVWLGVEPVMGFFTGGQTGWTPTDSVKYNGLVQGFPQVSPPLPYWTPEDPPIDVAFCLIEAPPPLWSCVDDPPMYGPPDNKQPGGNIDIEPNDACSLAVEALCEYAYCGDIADSFDVDWYYIDLPPDNSYGVHVRVFGNDTPNQYAQGLGLDPLVTLYGPDCLPIMANDDYFGTFPDAEGYDSQLNPVYPNCFAGGTRVYISVRTIWGLPGPYLLIINCVPCVIPTGACCVEEVCVATNYEPECIALGGDWYINETCPDFECPLTCLYAIYHNGDPIGGAVGSQCARDYPFVAETADDFVLPGAAPVDITDVIAWFWFWNPTVPDPGPAYYLGINVTIYANDLITLPYASPGGQPISPPDSACSHQENIPGGIVYTTQLLPTEYTYWDDGHPMYKLIMPIDTVSLNGGETYWLGIEPIMDFFNGGQTGWTPTDTIHGYVAEQIFPLLGYTVWTPTADPERDMAFCLLGPPLGCDYVTGDVNGSDSYNGLDIIYAVNYFKGGPDPTCPYGSCPIPPCDAFFYCGDVNASCNFNGLDVTYGVNYFKGGPDPMPCPSCPPIGGPAGDTGQPERPTVIKTKPVLEQKPGMK